MHFVNSTSDLESRDGVNNELDSRGYTKLIQLPFLSLWLVITHFSLLHTTHHVRVRINAANVLVF